VSYLELWEDGLCGRDEVVKRVEFAAAAHAHEVPRLTTKVGHLGWAQEKQGRRRMRAYAGERRVMELARDSSRGRLSGDKMSSLI
jgi:hypothetical protein